MKGFKRCDNGHFYKEDLDQCPYCPGGSATSGGNDMGKTQVGGETTSGGDLGKTQVFGSGGGGDKTQVFGAGGGNDSTQVFGGQSSGGGKKDLSKTFIQGVTDADDSPDGDAVSQTPRATRKLTGWLVSFTLDPMGLDYRLYEGNNSIGKAPENTITVTKDSTISSKHATILHKKGKFWIRDEMATNGTYLNNEELEIGQPYEMNDGDELKLGDTVFLFKKAF